MATAQTTLRRNTYSKDQGRLNQTGKNQSFQAVVTQPDIEAAVTSAPQGTTAINAAYPYRTKQKHI